MTQLETRRRLDSVWRGLRERHPGLTDWTFRINARCKGRLGQCRFDLRSIEVSEWVLSNPEMALDTLLHEAAHALVGPRAGHGARWKAMARQLGASPTGCATGAEMRSLAAPTHKWTLGCVACGSDYPRHRRDRRLVGRRCACGRGRYAYRLNPS